MHVLHAPTADLARSIILPTLTVEAEYGEYVCEGRFYTAAHHQKSGPYAGRHLPGYEETGRPSPCNDPGITRIGEEDLVVVSHVDLDTLGGCLRATGCHGELFSPRFQDFWNLAEFVDVTGPHRMDPEHPQAIYIRAVWAWLQENRPRYPRDEIVEITDLVYTFADVLWAILNQQSVPGSIWHNQDLIAAGEAMRESEDVLNESSFRAKDYVKDSYVIAAREADQFVNHLYRTPNGEVADVVVALNTKFESVTVSLANPIEGVSCEKLVQAVWREVTAEDEEGTALGTFSSPEAAEEAHPGCVVSFTAGGHAGIAGSPRGQVMKWSDVIDLCSEVKRMLTSLPTA